MPSQIITKNSVTGSAVPTTSDLVRGELALNLTDGRIYSRDEGTTIVELGINPSTIAITAGTINNAVIGATTAVAGTFTNLTATGTLTGTLATDAQPNITSLGTIAALVAGTGTFSGDIDVDGTTNLDVVDIDGAVDMASTLTIGANSGVIKEIGSDLSFVQGAVGLRINDAGSAISPTTATANSDGAVDLGVSNIRFKDAYLSGGVYLGGTGAANKLDDYEEGTFTPVVSGTSVAGAGTYTIQSGKYVIVGKMIHVSVRLGWSAHTGSGTTVLAGLPNTANNDYANLGVVYRDELTVSSGHTVNVGVVPNTNYANILEISTGTAGASGIALDTAVTDIAISGWYRIA